MTDGKRMIEYRGLQKIHLNRNNTDIISYYLWQNGSDNSAERERMKQILHRAIKLELTERQRDCIIMYYIKRMNMNDIATALGLTKSTVSRHIKSGISKLKKVAFYYHLRKELIECSSSTSCPSLQVS